MTKTTTKSDTPISTVTNAPKEKNKELNKDTSVMPRGVYIKTKISAQNSAKKIIAKHIADEYVNDFDAVLLDAGSTAEMIAEEIFSTRRYLSVLTNNMGAYAAYTRARGEIGNESKTFLEESRGSLNGNELLITGGRYVDTYEALLGDGAIKTIKPFTPNITVIGISGLRTHEGVFCHGAEESAVKSLLWTKPTDIRLIAADWSKIGKRDAHAFGNLEQLGVGAQKAVLVTCNPPKDIDEDILESFEEQLRSIENSNIIVKRLPIEDNENKAQQ